MEAGAVFDGLRPLLDGSGLPLDLASLAALAAVLGWDPLVFLAGLAVFMLLAMVALISVWRFVRNLWHGPARTRLGRVGHNGGQA